LEPGAYEIAMIGGGFTIVGTFAGAWIGYRLTEAATKFRAAFRDELLALNPALTKDAPDACDLLTAAFDKHRAAVFDFKPFLGTAHAERLEKAWQEYYRYPNPPSCTVPCLTQYSSKGCSDNDVRKRKFLAAERIERILSYAHYK
jgi:hypothetical protein